MSHRYEIYSVGNIVNNIVITLCGDETEHDPMVLAPCVLSLPFVCGKTLAKE